MLPLPDWDDFWYWSHQLLGCSRTNLRARHFLTYREIRSKLHAVRCWFLFRGVRINKLHQVFCWIVWDFRGRERVALVQQLLSGLLRCGFGILVLHAVRAWHNFGLGRHELRYSRSPKLLARHLLRNGEVRSELFCMRRWILCTFLGLDGLHALPCGQVFYSWRDILRYLPSKHGYSRRRISILQRLCCPGPRSCQRKLCSAKRVR